MTENIAPPPSVPQTRMEVVQIVPNVYELKLKAAFAPVVAKLQVEKAVVTAAASPLLPQPLLLPKRSRWKSPTATASPAWQGG